MNQDETINETFTKKTVYTEQEKDSTDKYPLDCTDCVVKHLAKAKVYLMEYQQNPEFQAELLMCIGNLACAEDHLLRLFGAQANICRQIRLCIMAGGVDVVEQIDEVIKNICEESDFFDKT